MLMLRGPLEVVERASSPSLSDVLRLLALGSCPRCKSSGFWRLALSLAGEALRNVEGGEVFASGFGVIVEQERIAAVSTTAQCWIVIYAAIETAQ